MEKFNKLFTVANTEETIKRIQEGMSICRYGDGEFTILLGGRTRLQPGDEKIVTRLKDILKDKSTNNVLVAIPEAFCGDYEKYTDDAAKFWKNYNEKNLDEISKMLDSNKTYYSSQITWFYTDIKDKSNCDRYVEEIKKIWNNKNIVIVEGLQTRMGIGNDLFSGAKTIRRILCPSENAFLKYEEILNSCLECSKDSMLIIALGATATILAYDLAKCGYQALDFGHIDLEYEWYIRKAKEKIKIKNKFDKEINDCPNIIDENDEEYQKSIIKIIE